MKIFIGKTMLSLRAINHPRKTPQLDVRSPFFEFLVKIAEESSKTLTLLLLFLLLARGGRQSPLAKDTMRFRHRV